MVISAFVNGLEGLSLIFPRIDTGRRLIYAKNGVVELPRSGTYFSLIVENFSRKAKTVKRGQILGVASPLDSAQVLLTPSRNGNEPATEKENILAEGFNHLKHEVRREAAHMLSEFSDIWDGRIGFIKAVEHHIPTTGIPFASQSYMEYHETHNPFRGSCW